MSARLLLLTALPLTALCLGACGGSAGSTTTEDPAGSKAPAAQPSESLAAARRKAGAAAAFVEPHADNSIPTFGSAASAEQRDRAEATLGAYLRARAAEQWGRACTYLAAATRRGLARLAKKPGTGCAAVYAALSKGADTADPLTHGLIALRVEGQNAFALFYGPHHQQYVMPMARQAGTWEMTQFAPIAYPPASQGAP